MNKLNSKIFFNKRYMFQTYLYESFYRDNKTSDYQEIFIIFFFFYLNAITRNLVRIFLSTFA